MWHDVKIDLPPVAPGWRIVSADVIVRVPGKKIGLAGAEVETMAYFDTQRDEWHVCGKNNRLYKLPWDAVSVWRET